MPVEYSFLKNAPRGALQKYFDNNLLLFLEFKEMMTKGEFHLDLLSQKRAKCFHMDK